MPANYARYLVGGDRTVAANRQLGWLLAFVAGAINAGGFLALIGHPHSLPQGSTMTTIPASFRQQCHHHLKTQCGGSTLRRTTAGNSK